MKRLMFRLRDGEVCRYDGMEMVDSGFKGLVATGKILVETTDAQENTHLKAIAEGEIVERWYVEG